MLDLANLTWPSWHALGGILSSEFGLKRAKQDADESDATSSQIVARLVCLGSSWPASDDCWPIRGASGHSEELSDGRPLELSFTQRLARESRDDQSS